MTALAARAGLVGSGTLQPMHLPVGVAFRVMAHGHAILGAPLCYAPLARALRAAPSSQELCMQSQIAEAIALKLKEQQ
jgi:hypothetical protein